MPIHNSVWLTERDGAKCLECIRPETKLVSGKIYRIRWEIVLLFWRMLLRASLSWGMKRLVHPSGKKLSESIRWNSFRNFWPYWLPVLVIWCVSACCWVLLLQKLQFSYRTSVSCVVKRTALLLAEGSEGNSFSVWCCIVLNNVRLEQEALVHALSSCNIMLWLWQMESS